MSRRTHLSCLYIVVILSGVSRAVARECNDVGWAVREARKPIYNNQILTKAMTYSIEWPGEPRVDASQRAAFESSIGQALQAALTEWGSSLLTMRASLDQHLREYLENASLCRPGSCQYSAPPAVRVMCRQNASIDFLVYAPGGAPFPQKEDRAVARAQTEGRTILLNVADYSFTYDQYLFAVLNERGTINLTAVIAHELGHSFGLGHADKGENSIMLASLTGTAIRRFPTARDGHQFAKILAVFLEGDKPGEFEAVRCQGLMVSAE